VVFEEIVNVTVYLLLVPLNEPRFIAPVVATGALVG
jgi:hypothetical protein